MAHYQCDMCGKVHGGDCENMPINPGEFRDVIITKEDLQVTTEAVNDRPWDKGIQVNRQVPRQEPVLKANEIQVGGRHYVSNYQHWDMVAKLGLDYYQGCATKYVTRRKGNRKEDLEKAKHFLQKRSELSETMSMVHVAQTDEDIKYLEEDLAYFSMQNRLSYREFRFLWTVCQGRWTDAIAHIDEMIKEL